MARVLAQALSLSVNDFKEQFHLGNPGFDSPWSQIQNLKYVYKKYAELLNACMNACLKESYITSLQVKQEQGLVVD